MGRAHRKLLIRALFFRPKFRPYWIYRHVRSGSIPEQELFVILLTNRVNPTRANEKIRQVRPALHDAVIESLGLARGESVAR